MLSVKVSRDEVDRLHRVRLNYDLLQIFAPG
ncbi:uncharacterized protein G2W53_009717 [Senna tora]|uniref:Uncharacterized protein n=1 Tax=Senna tora TaxID=362788 RepID=A0A834WYX3_9FABA|nr:uncharacterized protein G2W53_009717 [Senna tora]